METAYKTMVQYHNQNIDGDTVEMPSISVLTKIPNHAHFLVGPAHSSLIPGNHLPVCISAMLSLQECYINGITQNTALQIGLTHTTSFPGNPSKLCASKVSSF
jgi:hypothetical protein